MRSMMLIVTVILATACGGSYGTDPTQEGNAHTVEAVGATAWNPTTVSLAAGETVTFHNGTGIVHNVRFDAVGVVPPGDVADFTSGSRSVTFATAGTFAYHCGIHPGMQGTVVVGP